MLEAWERMTYGGLRFSNWFVGVPLTLANKRIEAIDAPY